MYSLIHFSQSSPSSESFRTSVFTPSMNQSTVTAYLMQFIMRKIDNAVSVHFDYIHVEVPNYILLKCI